MRTAVTLLVLSLGFVAATAANPPVPAAKSPGQTAADLGCGRPGLDDATQARCAQLDLAESKQELADAYNEVLKRYAADTAFIAKLKASQAAWSAYFDAEMAALYPDPRGVAAYGSTYPSCNADAASYLIDRRTQELRRWLDGAEEGDVCAGSIHTKDADSAD